MSQNLINKYFFVLFSIIPISIIVGPSVSLANILIIVFSFLIYIFYINEWSWLKDKKIQLLFACSWCTLISDSNILIPKDFACSTVLLHPSDFEGFINAKEFIINQLNLNGVLAADYGENKIYISWKIEDLNYNQYKTYSEKMVPKNNVYKVGVSPLDTRPTPIYPKSNYNNNNRSRNKSKIIGEEGKVSMFQYDERYQDLIPVNTEKLKKQFPQPQKPKKPSFLRNRNQRNYYDKSYDSTSKYPKQTPRFPPRSKRDHRISIDLDDHYLQ